MSYQEHMWVSLNICYLFGVGSAKALIHAIFPDICVTSASDTVRRAVDLLATTGCRQDTNE